MTNQQKQRFDFHGESSSYNVNLKLRGGVNDFTAHLIKAQGRFSL